VRYAETDQMGVVHHASYLVWFELARTNLCACTGHSYAGIEAMGFLLVICGAEIVYRQPARYGEVVQATSWIDELASRRMRFGYEVRRRGELLVTGTTSHLWVDRATRRSCRIPESLREPFVRLAGSRSRLKEGSPCVV
jgi:acyl-CoA thioester hydrolase